MFLFLSSGAWFSQSLIASQLNIRDTVGLRWNGSHSITSQYRTHTARRNLGERWAGISVTPLHIFGTSLLPSTRINADGWKVFSSLRLISFHSASAVRSAVCTSASWRQCRPTFSLVNFFFALCCELSVCINVTRLVIVVEKTFSSSSSYSSCSCSSIFSS